MRHSCKGRRRGLRGEQIPWRGGFAVPFLKSMPHVGWCSLCRLHRRCSVRRKYVWLGRALAKLIDRWGGDSAYSDNVGYETGQQQQEKRHAFETETLENKRCRRHEKRRRDEGDRSCGIPKHTRSHVLSRGSSERRRAAVVGGSLPDQERELAQHVWRRVRE